jgi:hypothetical protein
MFLYLLQTNGTCSGHIFLPDFREVQDLSMCRVYIIVAIYAVTCRPNLQLPEDGPDMWPKHVVA